MKPPLDCQGTTGPRGKLSIGRRVFAEALGPFEKIELSQKRQQLRCATEQLDRPRGKRAPSPTELSGDSGRLPSKTEHSPSITIDELWAAVDSALSDPDVLPEKPPGWFTAEEYRQAHPGITFYATQSFLQRKAQAGKLNAAFTDCMVGGRRRKLRIYGVAR
jgi:hypothetical protein